MKIAQSVKQPVAKMGDSALETTERKPLDFAKIPETIASQFDEMVKSGSVAASDVNTAARELGKLASKAAELRRGKVSKPKQEKFESEIAKTLDNYRQEGVSKPANPNTKILSALKSSYGEAVVNHPGGEIFQDEHSAVRTYYGKRQSEAKKGAVKNFQAFLQESWSKFDKDGDNKLQFNEVWKAAGDKRYRNEKVDYLALLVGKFSLLAGSYEPSPPKPVAITRTTVDSLVDPATSELSKHGKSIAKSSLLNPEHTVEKAWSQRGDMDNVYGKELVPYNLRQGSIGDCWLISYASSRSAEDLKTVVKPHPDKNAAVVQLRGDKERVIEPPSKAQAHISAKSDGYWGFAIEEALRQRGRDSTPVVPGEDVLYDGEQAEAHSYLFGDKTVALLSEQTPDLNYYSNFHVNNFEKTTKPSDFRKFLKEAFDEGSVVFTGSFGGSDRMTLENSVVGYHAYQVTDYDEKSDLVSVRNPWGGNDPRDKMAGSPEYDGVNDGIYSLPMPEFFTTFSNVLKVIDEDTSGGCP